MSASKSGRPNQRSRTRKDLIEAAARLMKQGGRPSLEDVAAEALISRATAYRYFPSVDALMSEAAVDVAVPNAEAALRDAPPGDPIARLERVDAALDEMMSANEAALRAMLMHSLQQGAERDPALPARQNRRGALIEAALEPARAQFKPAAMKTLAKAMALVVGTESMIVFKDVLQVDEAEARKIKRWMIRALVDAARKTL